MKTSTLRKKPLWTFHVFPLPTRTISWGNTVSKRYLTFGIRNSVRGTYSGVIWRRSLPRQYPTALVFFSNRNFQRPGKIVNTSPVGTISPKKPFILSIFIKALNKQETLAPCPMIQLMVQGLFQKLTKFNSKQK